MEKLDVFTETYFTEEQAHAVVTEAIAVKHNIDDMAGFDVDGIIRNAFRENGDTGKLALRAGGESRFWEVVEAHNARDRMTGDDFKRVRRYLHFSPHDMADALGVGRATISHWEMGRSPIPYDVCERLREVVTNQIAALRWVRTSMCQ